MRVTAFPKGVFRLASGRLSSTVDLRDGLNGCWSGTYDGMDPDSTPSGGQAATRVIDLVRKGGAWYLTFQDTLNSRCNVQGLCGAGSSVSLVWLKLTPALKVAARQIEAVEDCTTDLSVTDWTGRKNSQEAYLGGPLFELKGGALQVVSVVSGYGKKLDTLTTLSYRHAAAERGFLVFSKTVPRN